MRLDYGGGMLSKRTFTPFIAAERGCNGIWHKGFKKIVFCFVL